LLFIECQRLIVDAAIAQGIEEALKGHATAVIDVEQRRDFGRFHLGRQIVGVKLVTNIAAIGPIRDKLQSLTDLSRNMVRDGGQDGVFRALTQRFRLCCFRGWLNAGKDAACDYGQLILNAFKLPFQRWNTVTGWSNPL